MVRRFGAEAYTAGFKVTTTLDSRLQKAANRAMHNTLLAYDERHGYRGPLAHVDLPASGAADKGASVNELRALLEDHPNVVDYETAIVLAVEPQSARVFFADRGEQTIGFDAMTWAAPFVNDDAVGTRPTSVTEVLKVGDIVRFRQDRAGHWRLAQIPEVEGAFASVDPLDGGVVALTGGFDFFLSNYNRATQAKRQPGSSFKPFVYSAALQNGFTPATIVNDSPPEGEYQAELERVWRPENFNNEYFGFVSLRFALQHSLNAVSIRIAKAMGVPTVVALRAQIRLRRHGDSEQSVDRARCGRRRAARPRDGLRDVRERRLPRRSLFHPANRECRRRSGVRGQARVRVPGLRPAGARRGGGQLLEAADAIAEREAGDAHAGR